MAGARPRPVEPPRLDGPDQLVRVGEHELDVERGMLVAQAHLLGGQVDLHFASLPAALPLVKSGKLRALAMTSPKCAPQLPDVPTLAESGFPNFDYQVFYGVMALAGTPSDRVARLNAAIERALATPALREKLTGMASACNRDRRKTSASSSRASGASSRTP